MELQYTFLQEKYAGEVEQHYPGIRRLMHEFDNPVMQSAIQLQAILDLPDDQTVPRASSLFQTRYPLNTKFLCWYAK